MNRKEITNFLNELLKKDRLTGPGKHWSSEVSIDPFTTRGRRIDFMEFIQCSLSGIEKGIFICYEVKSCEKDVYSGNGLNFYGEKNYIVTTIDCYKNLLPDLKNFIFLRHVKKCNPESSNYYGVMVAVPRWRNVKDELEDPTPLDTQDRRILSAGTTKEKYDRTAFLYATKWSIIFMYKKETKAYCTAEISFSFVNVLYLYNLLCYHQVIQNG